MQCPFCGGAESQVKDSRPVDDNDAIRRRRVCVACGARFSTLERIQLRELQVIKGSGLKEPFKREKLYRSLAIALRKRPIDDEVVARVTNSIIRQLESLGESDISSHDIGRFSMEMLQELDQVAFVRYASVYQNFSDLEDFKKFMKSLAETKKAS